MAIFKALKKMEKNPAQPQVARLKKSFCKTMTAVAKDSSLCSENDLPYHESLEKDQLPKSSATRAEGRMKESNMLLLKTTMSKQRL